MTYATILGTRCTIISTTGPKGKEMITAQTESGVAFQSTLIQFTKDWKPYEEKTQTTIQTKRN
jgi:hypothetical protein